MSDKEAESAKDGKSKRLIDALDGRDDDEEKRSMRKKPRVDYSEEKKLAQAAENQNTVGQTSKLDDDDEIQVKDKLGQRFVNLEFSRHQTDLKVSLEPLNITNPK